MYYYPVCRCPLPQALLVLARLACLIHAANVHSEPGSNPSILSAKGSKSTHPEAENSQDFQTFFLNLIQNEISTQCRRDAEDRKGLAKGTSRDPTPAETSLFLSRNAREVKGLTLLISRLDKSLPPCADFRLSACKSGSQTGILATLVVEFRSDPWYRWGCLPRVFPPSAVKEFRS